MVKKQLPVESSQIQPGMAVIGKTNEFEQIREELIELMRKEIESAVELEGDKLDHELDQRYDALNSRLDRFGNSLDRFGNSFVSYDMYRHHVHAQRNSHVCTYGPEHPGW